MGQVGMAQLRTLLENLRQGSLSFENYVESLGDDIPEYQTQIRAAFEQSKAAAWSLDEYQAVRLVLQDEFDLQYEAQHRGEVKATFNPWADKLRASVLPSGWSWDPETGKAIREDGDMSHVVPTAEAATGKAAKPKSTDPMRASGGRFEANVAELWYINEQGVVCRKAFTTGTDPIARAHEEAAEIQSYWKEAGLRATVALVKARLGESEGNKHVYHRNAMGYIASPQEVLEWHIAARSAGIRQKVGEKMCKTNTKVISMLLEANQQFKADDAADRTCCDMPIFEAPSKKETVYSVQFQSGARRSIVAVALSDDKDADGNVTMTGHRKRALRILLDTPCTRADSPQTIKYMWDGKPHVVGRREALEWSESDEAEDEILVKLWEAFHKGDISDEEYVAKRGKRLEQLDPQQARRTGGYQTLNKASARLGWKAAQENPDGTVTKGRWDWKGNRVDYGSDGRVYWGKAKTRGWEGNLPGQSHYEAQVYNM